jgi:hypothetical protein
MSFLYNKLNKANKSKKRYNDESDNESDKDIDESIFGTVRSKKSKKIPRILSNNDSKTKKAVVNITESDEYSSSVEPEILSTTTRSQKAFVEESVDYGNVDLDDPVLRSLSELKRKLSTTRTVNPEKLDNSEPLATASIKRVYSIPKVASAAERKKEAEALFRPTLPLEIASEDLNDEDMISFKTRFNGKNEKTFQIGKAAKFSKVKCISQIYYIAFDCRTCYR